MTFPDTRGLLSGSGGGNRLTQIGLAGLASHQHPSGGYGHRRGQRESYPSGITRCRTCDRRPPWHSCLVCPSMAIRPELPAINMIDQRRQ